jgi:hypothetical protein
VFALLCFRSLFLTIFPRNFHCFFLAKSLLAVQSAGYLLLSACYSSLTVFDPRNVCFSFPDIHYSVGPFIQTMIIVVLSANLVFSALRVN